ncbi:diguanylate cyclase [uncultured Halopseudomonas sp.]|uniref:diguanylate cyclase n=1 Tax=uncultured Halopseudomonas sp. TaxID=2901193 RepID=UPI0030ED74A1|tara:strand:+ start:123896 stop:125551 length:1656 start_codon:yes stop_codon:yes gene_type:complete
MANADLQAQLAALSRSFRARLQVELQSMNARSEELLAQPTADAGNLAPLRSELHKLAGSAGTFGFAELGAQARTLELIITRSMDSGVLSHADRQVLLAGIKSLPAKLDQSEAPQPASAITFDNDDSDVRCIAIVEPDGQLLQGISDTLESFGYKTVVCGDVGALLNIMAAEAPDALVVDMSLPQWDAQWDAAVAQVQIHLPEPLPLIALSDQDGFAAQLHAVRAGAQGFFTHPVDLPGLENRLERCFSLQHSEPFRVLVIDDDIELAERFIAVLAGFGMLAETLDAPELILEQMRRFQPDVVMMDVNMPDYSGPELAQIIRLNDEWLRVPIIYLSAETDVQQQMAALIKAGDDFITKPISDSALLTAVYSRAQRARRVSQALAKDSLTGLLKHADIKDQLELEADRAVRNKQPLSVAMIDIDHFKNVNDSHGHAVGDNVIRSLANLLRQRLRKVDRLGRYGGEEFVAVLPNCSPADAWRILDSIRSDFHALPFSSDAGLFHCGFSAGISFSQAPDWQTDSLLESADKMLYEAKQQGRNQIIAVPGSNEAAK